MIILASIYPSPSSSGQGNVSRQDKHQDPASSVWQDDERVHRRPADAQHSPAHQRIYLEADRVSDSTLEATSELHALIGLEQG